MSLSGICIFALLILHYVNYLKSILGVDIKIFSTGHQPIYCGIIFAEVEINKLRSEEAGLRDALLKMQALNEGLGQDKIELNRIIMHLEQEKATLQVIIAFHNYIHSQKT